jgi:hypothetical protein
MSRFLLRVNDRVRKEVKRRSAAYRKGVRRRRLADRHPNEDRGIVWFGGAVLKASPVLASPRPRQAYRTEGDRPTVRLTGVRRCHSLAYTEYRCEIIVPFGP